MRKVNIAVATVGALATSSSVGSLNYTLKLFAEFKPMLGTRAPAPALSAEREQEFSNAYNKWKFERAAHAVRAWAPAFPAS